MSNTNDAKKAELVAAVREKCPEVAEVLAVFANQIGMLESRVSILEGKVKPLM